MNELFETEEEKAERLAKLARYLRFEDEFFESVTNSVFAYPYPPQFFSRQAVGDKNFSTTCRLNHHGWCKEAGCTCACHKKLVTPLPVAE